MKGVDLPLARMQVALPFDSVRLGLGCMCACLRQGRLRQYAVVLSQRRQMCLR